MYISYHYFKLDVLVENCGEFNANLIGMGGVNLQIIASRFKDVPNLIDN